MSSPLIYSFPGHDLVPDGVYLPAMAGAQVSLSHDLNDCNRRLYAEPACSPICCRRKKTCSRKAKPFLAIWRSSQGMVQVNHLINAQAKEVFGGRASKHEKFPKTRKCRE
ncbi:MAG: hypothetical protein ACH34Y_00140 [Brachymonas sp.]|jgi:hypothetical protein